MQLVLRVCDRRVELARRHPQQTGAGREPQIVIGVLGEREDAARRQSVRPADERELPVRKAAQTIGARHPDRAALILVERIVRTGAEPFLRAERGECLAQDADARSAEGDPEPALAIGERRGDPHVVELG